MKTLRNAILGLAILTAGELSSPEAKALTVSFSNLNTAVSSSNVWVMFGGASQSTLSGTLTYSGSTQGLTFGTTYRLSQIANQAVTLQAGTSGKIFILYSASGTDFNGSNGTPAYNYGQVAASVGARWDKVEFTQYATSGSKTSGFNMSAADFFSIPLMLQTYNSGTPVATSGWHPLTPTATVFQNLSTLIATGSAQPYAIVQSTTTSGTAYSIPVTVSGTTLNVLRIVNPQQVPLTVVGTNNPLPNPYASFVPYISAAAKSGNRSKLQGTYGGASGTALPASYYVTQDYYFTSTITTSGNLIISGSTVANINTGSAALPSNPQTIRVAASDLPQGIYTAAPPYTVDGISGTQVGSNCVYDQVISDLLAGFNLGLVGSTVVDPRLSNSGTLNNIPAGTVLGKESSAAWFSTGPQYGLNPMLSAAQAFNVAQPKYPNFYNQFAQYVSSVTDAYSFPYTDKTAAPLLTTTPGVADTIVVSILSDNPSVSGLQSPKPRAVNKPVRFFGSTSSSLRIQGQPRLPFSDIKVHLEIDHENIGDLVVRLHSPLGQIFTLHKKSGDSGDKLLLSGMPLSSEKSTRPNGVWRLVIDDTKKGNSGTLVNWGLEFPVQP